MKKVALITGANKGLGLESARQLGRLGITILAAARDAQKGNSAVATLRSEGIDAHFVQLDVTRGEDISAVRRFIEDTYGRLDILVNNAGLIRGEGWGGNSVTTISEEDLQATFDANFFGPVRLTQELLPLLHKSEAGRIVNLSSIMGSLTLHADPASPIYGSKPFAYDASKTALNQFTVHLAAALEGSAIKVNSAHPGWVKTELGTDAAPMDVVRGAQTTVALATLPADGPSGRYIHLGEELPW